MRVRGTRLGRILLMVAFVIGTIAPAFDFAPVSALQITPRSLTLQSGDNVSTYDADADNLIDGGSQPGGIVDHKFDFTIPSDTPISSIKFLYCVEPSNSDGTNPCTMPTGLDTTNATLGAESGINGFSVNAATAGAPYVHLATPYDAADGVDTAISVTLDGITNPGDPDVNPNETFFVRIFTYGTTDASGTPTDIGTVAASTAEQIRLSGTMPESLIFCTGETIGVNGASIPDCSTATSGDIAFDQLFSPQDTATATSQMAASTNAGQGYAITVAGPTLTSGSNTIPAMGNAGTAEASAVGVGQFGLNLVANTLLRADDTTTLGAAIAPVSDPATAHNGRAVPGYDTADMFQYASGAVIADSDFAADGSGEPTNSQIYTVSYIVNVSGAQPAGTYATTLTYVCTATF